MTQVANDTRLQGLIEEYMQGFFDWNPLMAADLGLHQYDGRVNDVSPAVQATYIFRLKDLRTRLAALPEHRDKEADFDRQLLDQTLRHELFELEDLERWATNPMSYADLIEVSLYVKRDYAPLAERMTKLVQHLEGVPRALEQGRTNLLPRLARPALETAITIYEGAITYLEDVVNAEVAKTNQPDLISHFEQARQGAVQALRDFVAFLKGRLPDAHFDFAIGAEKYRKMLASGEMMDLPVEEVLAVGQRDLARNQAALKALVENYRPGASVEEVMNDISKDHSKAENLVRETTDKLEEVRQFLLDHKIVSVPSEVRCIVTETPPFLRWGFASMDAPGPFEEAALEAYYYLTPVEPYWTDQQKEEWLSLFDYYTVQTVSIHEAYPGHYLQFLHTKLVPSRFRKLIKAYSFVEGWAHYTEQMMLEEGFGAGDLRFKIAQLVEALLRDSRYIASVRMHTQGMTVDEAARFIRENAYIGETLARSEAQRGTFNPGYLGYTLGKLLLLKLREDYKAEQGDRFNLQEFHDRVLAYGAPPVPLLRSLLLQHDDGQIL